MENLKELLIRSFDGELTAAEQEALEQGLARSPELREEKAALESLRQSLGAVQPAFREGFSDRVMQRLDAADARATLPAYSVFKRVALSGVAAIAVLLLSVYFTEGSLSLDALTGLAGYTPEEASIFFNL